MERDIDQLRKKNEKLARAIKRVKENPSLVDEVKKQQNMNEDELEYQIVSKPLDELRQKLNDEMLKKNELELEG